MDEAREPEDRIEHIVKEAEQGAQFEFNPAAWNAMEQKLDAVNPVPFSVWKIIFPLTGVALLLMLLLWPVGAQDIARRQAQIEQAEAKAQQEQPAAKVEKSEAETGAEEKPKPAEENQTAADQDIDDNNKVEVDETIQQPKPTDSNTVTSTDDAANTVVDAVEPRPASTKPVVPSIPDVYVAAPEQEQETATDSGSGGSEARDARSGVEMLSIRWVPSLLTLPAFEPVFEMDSTHFKEGMPKPYFEKSRWALSAMVSLDMSATGLDGFTDPGTMFGVGVEYYLAPTWSIQSGAAIAVKKYSALGSEYTIEGWGAARVENLQNVLANCLVIDIPINIRKYFYTKKGNTWFASTGISSYLMLREDYDYDYTENIPNWAETWQVKNQNQHYLGILNLSFGYETPISTNLGFAVEPFVKLPLTGIGQGSVKFLSFGTVLAIKLRK